MPPGKTPGGSLLASRKGSSLESSNADGLGNRAMGQRISRFLQWNDGLVEHFFRPEMAERPVYLYVTRNTLAEVGAREGIQPEEFVEAVKEGPPWATRQGFCQRALQACIGWRHRELEFPPYFAYLALFVMAVGVEGDFAPHAYYPRLRQLLGEDEGGMLPSFDRMLDLWDDLEQWATRDKKGRLGLFEARIVGGWIHVGLPLAQTILTDEERKSLPRIFAGAGLDPGSVPPDDEVVRSLRLHGKDYLKPRTRRLVDDQTDQDRLSAIIDVVIEELAEWDGRVGAEEADEVSIVFGALRLCATWDPVSQVVGTSLRCRINGDFPDGLLTLRGAGLEVELVCEEAIGGWSTELTDARMPGAVDGRILHWRRGALLSDTTGRWRFSLRGSPIRVLVPGMEEGLPGFVEVGQLPRLGRFCILFRAEIAENVRKWALEGCEKYEELFIGRGLPRDWLFAQAASLLPGRALPPALSVVAPSTRVRMTFVGGVRSAAGNNYFSFAPPTFRIEGGTGNERVWCDGVELKGKSRQYRIPLGSPVEKRIVVEVRRGSETIRRRSLYLTGDFVWSTHRAVSKFDRWGRPAPERRSAPAVCGARVSGTVNTGTYRVHALQVVAEVDAWKRRTFLVGRRIGEISRWPQDPSPSGWEPVWAIPIETRGRALFCGSDLNRCRPLGGRCSNKAGRKWKQVLWSWRYRIEPPPHPEIRDLWKDYQEAARCA